MADQRTKLLVTWPEEDLEKEEKKEEGEQDESEASE